MQLVHTEEVSGGRPPYVSAATGLPSLQTLTCVLRIARPVPRRRLCLRQSGERQSAWRRHRSAHASPDHQVPATSGTWRPLPRRRADQTRRMPCGSRRPPDPCRRPYGAPTLAEPDRDHCTPQVGDGSGEFATCRQPILPQPFLPRGGFGSLCHPLLKPIRAERAKQSPGNCNQTPSNSAHP